MCAAACPCLTGSITSSCAVRELVAEGMSDTEIAIQLAEQAAEDAASAAEHEAMYGFDDPHEADRSEWLPSCGLFCETAEQEYSA